jgi:hypothetical protein
MGNERIFAAAAAAVAERARAREGKQMWCDEGGGTAKIIDCAASRVARLLVHMDLKDELLHPIVR